ncbi:MAG: hypothetical protein AB7N65_10465 [Vicinamibacterales bacterium]
MLLREAHPTMIWGRDRLVVAVLICAVRRRGVCGAGSDNERCVNRPPNVDYPQAKSADAAIRGTVQAHRDDRIFLEGAYRAG